MKRYLLTAIGLCVVSSMSVAEDVKVIRFGVEAAYPPFEYKNDAGKLTGFDIDIGNALCAEIKAKCEWIETPFDGLIPALKSKKIDAINSALSITDKRKQSVYFTVPLYQVPTRLIAKQGSGLTPDAASLKGKKVGVLRGSIQDDYANQKLKPFGVEVTSYADQNTIYLDLLAKRIDGTLVDATSGQEGLLNKPEGKGYAFAGPAVKDPLLGSGIGIAVRKGDLNLLKSLNDAFGKIKANGTYNKIIKKYFDFDISI